MICKSSRAGIIGVSPLTLQLILIFGLNVGLTCKKKTKKKHLNHRQAGQRASLTMYQFFFKGFHQRWMYFNKSEAVQHPVTVTNKQSPVVKRSLSTLALIQELTRLNGCIDQTD